MSQEQFFFYFIFFSWPARNNFNSWQSMKSQVIPVGHVTCFLFPEGAVQALAVTDRTLIKMHCTAGRCGVTLQGVRQPHITALLKCRTQAMQKRKHRSYFNNKCVKIYTL